MTEYERQTTLAAWRWVCRKSYGNEVSTEVMENSAREIAGYFDLPYLSVLEDLLKEHERLQMALDVARDESLKSFREWARGLI